MKFKKKECERVPRKLKKQIPVGVYCYKGISHDVNTGIYKVKHCVFSSSIKIKDKPIIEDYEKEFLEETIHWCKLVKTEPEDSCKSCGIKYGF